MNAGADLWVVQGTLKGHDQLMNLVLDDVQEMLRGMSHQSIAGPLLQTPSLPFSLSQSHAPTLLYTCRRLILLPTDDEGNTSTRSLGLIVARGTLLVLISPLDGSEEIANPFNNQEED